jgi:VWFA-related protein
MRLRILSSAACVLLSTAAAWAQEAPTQAQTQTLSVDARLVVVPVTVRDPKDHLIRTLTREDFTLTADGKPQAIRYFDREDDLPLTVGLLVDVSGSQRTVLEAERTASSAFLDGMLTPGRDRAFVVQFGKSADLLADITPSLPKLQAALQKIEADSEQRPAFRNDNGNGNDPNDDSNSGSGNGGGSNSGGNGGYGGGRRGGQGGGRGRGGAGGSAGGGGTVLYDAVYLSSDEVLKKAPAGSSKDTPADKTATPASPTRKALILLTDGDDRGSKEGLADAIEAAQRTDVTLYAIYYKGEEDRGGGGFGGGFPGRLPGGGSRGGGFPGGGGRSGGGGGNRGNDRVDGKKILERMADETGGRVYEVTKKMTLTEIYRQIAEELRSQYRLGFSPANNEPGYHKLIVDTPKQKKVILQARDGYYAGAAGK